MKGGQQILIISHEATVPEWALMLADKLRSSGIQAEISRPDKSALPTSIVVTDLPEESAAKAVIYFKSHDHDAYPFLSGLSVYLRNEKGDIQVVRAALRKFRSRKEEQLQAVYALDKAIRLFLNGTILPVTDKQPELRPARQSGKLQRWFTKDIWHTAILDAPIQEIAFSKQAHAIRFPFKEDGVLRADPFGLIRDGEEYLFYEQQTTDKPGAVCLLYNGREHVLLKGHHLSYPYVFEADGNIWCIPEQHVTRSTELYSFDPKTLRLTHATTILKDFPASDPTVFYHNGSWWLYCTDTDHQGANSRLHLYFADHLNGPWKPHPMNPVVFSVCGGRPAGTPFLHEGKLYRPGQDNSRGYGGSILFFEVTTISRTSYMEVPAGELVPGDIDASYSGLHTISEFGNQTLIDLKKKVFSFRNLLRLLRKKRVHS